MSLVGRLRARFVSDPSVELQRRICAEYDRAAVLPQPGFPSDVLLPASYGQGMPERVVEILLARLSATPGSKTLDIGHANAMQCHLHMLLSLPEPHRLVGLDLAEPCYDTTPYYEESVQADATQTPFSDAEFDLVWCISAIEHFGMDNSGYGDDSKPVEDADVRAVGEIVRLLRPGGIALITVPYGKFEDHGWFRQYDAALWQRLLSSARPACQVCEHYFRHTEPSGWSKVQPEDLREVGYFDQPNQGAAGLAAAYLLKSGA